MNAKLATRTVEIDQDRLAVKKLCIKVPCIYIALHKIIGNVQFLNSKLTKANFQYIEFLLIRMTEPI